VHSDIRWPNVLVGIEGWFLIDFENAKSFRGTNQATKEKLVGEDWLMLGKLIKDWTFYQLASPQLHDLVDKRLTLTTPNRRTPSKKNVTDQWLFT